MCEKRKNIDIECAKKEMSSVESTSTNGQTPKMNERDLFFDNDSKETELTEIIKIPDCLRQHHGDAKMKL
jgi:hypothetical protein